MIIDTSVIIAILREEGEADLFLELMADNSPLLMSAGSRVEVNVVTARTMQEISKETIDGMMARLQVIVVPVSPRQVEIADEGYRRFGQGSGHPAKLNFGDCFAYALAKETGEPLLFKGDDFAQTDIAAAA